MGREENAAIFRDTEKMCRTHPRLKESIARSRAGQRLILEGDAVNVPPCGDGDRHIELPPDKLRALHERRLARILDIAAASGEEAVILGAFGCGAFRNDPRVVAAAAAAVVPRYRTRFKIIEFAVFCRPGDTRNYDAFRTNIVS